MKKNTVKLNKNTLRKIVAESVKKVLKEEGEIKTFKWNEPEEHEYIVCAMIRSDFNPLQYKVKAFSIEEAIEKSKKYFARFSRYGEEDVDIYYIRHKDYDYE